MAKCNISSIRIQKMVLLVRCGSWKYMYFTYLRVFMLYLATLPLA